jgi:hypothetical protein
MGKRMYAPFHPEAPIWDDKESHISLVQRLIDEYPDGWALSCNPADLQWLLPHCPSTVRVAAWAKTFHQIRPKTSVQYAWEPVIWNGGRLIANRNPMVRDWLSCARNMRKGLPGAKPHKFNQWVLELLGYDPTLDQIDDLFPGTHGMTAAANEMRLT